MKIDFKGLISAPFTPLNKNGSLNLDLIPDYITSLLDNGIKNVFVLGSTSEGLSLTTNERKEVAEKWMECGRNRLDKIVIHVGTNVIATDIELAKHAEKIGADGISMLPPSYYPITLKHVRACLKTVAEAVPNLPIMYYHLPAFSTVHIDLESLLDFACKEIPNFCGVKYSDSDLMTFSVCLMKYGNEVEMCYGSDQNSFFARTMGCESFVGSTYNYCANLYHQMLEAYEEGRTEDAKKWQERIMISMNLVNSKGYDLALQKRVASEVLGLDMGPPRLPNLPSTSEDDELIRQIKESFK